MINLSLYDYKQSQEIAGKDYPFYALVMAAMRQADDVNLPRLQTAFPQEWIELQARYHSPGGVLDSEREGGDEIDRD